MKKFQILKQCLIQIQTYQINQMFIKINHSKMVRSREIIVVEETEGKLKLCLKTILLILKILSILLLQKSDEKGIV